MKASDVLEGSIATLKASRAIDHWQRDRERIEAEDLLLHALGTDEVAPDLDVPAGARRRFERLIARRARGEPVQLIKGYAVFRGLEISASPGVFVPRDSTEYLAEQAVRRLRGRRRPIAVDLATGGGTVALAIANEVSGVRVFGTDISARAIRVARRNAARLRLGVTFRVGDVFGGLSAELAGRVDVVTLHPPYVARGEMRELPAEIRRFEPVHTLTDKSPDGLGLIGRATTGAPSWLKPGGWLLIEVSPDRARADGRGDATCRAHRGPEHGRSRFQGDAGARGSVAGLSAPERIPYGAWPSPISAERVAKASLLLSESFAIGDSTTWIEERPDEGGRYVVMWAGPGTEPAEVTSRTVVRSNAGARVRRRVLRGAGLRGLLHGRRRPAAVPARDRRRAGRPLRGAPRAPRVPLRGHGRLTRRVAGRLRARTTRIGRAAGERPGAGACGRLGRTDGRGFWAATSTRSPAGPPTAGASRSSSGTSLGCPGTAPS